MIKLSLRSLAQYWVRFALTTLAVVIGVAFVVSAFVLADSLTRIFDRLAGDISAGIDVQVRGKDPFGRSATNFNSDPPPVPSDVLASLQDVQGAARVDGFLQAPLAASTAGGKAITSGQGPTIGFGWTEPTGRGSDWIVTEGKPPAGERDVVIDGSVAKNFDVGLGDAITVNGPSADFGGEFEVVGIAKFGESGTAGAYFLLFETRAAQRLFNIGDAYQAVVIQAEDGVSPTTLRDRVADRLPEGYEAVTGDQFNQEFSDTFGQIIDILRGIFLGFAGVTLVASTFLINTVFNITLSQRLRQLALLRAIGASASQIRRSVLFEALVVGIVGSIVGAILGVGGAALIKLIFTRAGAQLPDGPLVLAPRTWIAAFIVGIGVTALVSLAPAWRAGRVPPLAALRDGYSLKRGRPLVRAILGGLMLLLGALQLAVGLFGDPGSTSARITVLVIGSLLIFFGVAVISPLVARPLARLIGWVPARASGVAGQLARNNAASNPFRTSSTASALMVGVALVGMAGVLAQSFKNSVVEQLNQGVKADYFISQEGQGFGFSPKITEELAATPVVGQLTTFRFGDAKLNGSNPRQVAGVQPEGLGSVLDLGIIAGSIDDFGDDGLLIQKDAAADLGVTAGDTVTIELPIGEPQQVTISAVYQRGIGGLGDRLVSRVLLEKGLPPDQQLDAFGALTLAPGTDPATAEAALQAVADKYPEINLEDRSSFVKSQQDQINQTLILVNSLLVTTVVVGILGIAITLSLAVFERTREIGLLRAIGQSRRETRKMIRLEAIIVALFGTLLGLVLGLIFGVTLTSALPDDFISTIAIPWGQVVLTLIGAIIAGVVAALWPAWRASRLKVLDAIAYE